MGDFAFWGGIAALAAGGLYGVTSLLFKGDDRIEERRKTALKVGGWAAKNGVPYLPTFLNAYAIGNYSDVLSHLGRVNDAIDDGTAEAGVQKFLEAQLNMRLDDPALREDLFARIEKRLNITIPKPALTQAGDRVALTPKS
jgi:hypothetical protein